MACSVYPIELPRNYDFQNFYCLGENGNIVVTRIHFCACTKSSSKANYYTQTRTKKEGDSLILFVSYLIKNYDVSQYQNTFCLVQQGV